MKKLTLLQLKYALEVYKFILSNPYIEICHSPSLPILRIMMLLADAKLIILLFSAGIIIGWNSNTGTHCIFLATKVHCQAPV